METELTPKEAFEFGVQMAREKKREIQRRVIEMEKGYEQWLFDYLEIEGISIWE